MFFNTSNALYLYNNINNNEARRFVMVSRETTMYAHCRMPLFQAYTQEQLVAVETPAIDPYSIFLTPALHGCVVPITRFLLSAKTTLVVGKVVISHGILAGKYKCRGSSRVVFQDVRTTRGVVFEKPRLAAEGKKIAIKTVQ